MKKIEVKNGDKHGRLTIIGEMEPINDSHRSWRVVECKCSCGKIATVRLHGLRSGNTKSCGCLVIETIRRHNMSGTRTYISWINMKNRCKNKNSPKFNIYGGRGISYDQSWEKFENFYADMGERPEGKSLDRIDSNGNYCKENCRWATPVVQANNMCTNHIVYYQNEKISISQLSKKLGIKRVTLDGRLRAGRSLEEACSTVDHRCRKNPHLLVD